MTCIVPTWKPNTSIAAIHRRPVRDGSRCSGARTTAGLDSFLVAEPTGRSGTAAGLSAVDSGPGGIGTEVITPGTLARSADAAIGRSGESDVVPAQLAAEQRYGPLRSPVDDGRPTVPGIVLPRDRRSVLPLLVLRHRIPGSDGLAPGVCHL
ncbi:hypothetical protein GCM10027280_19390 [Micromonospora polyrhachis]